MSSLRTTVASFLRFVAAGLLLLGVALLATGTARAQEAEPPGPAAEAEGTQAAVDPV